VGRYGRSCGNCAQYGRGGGTVKEIDAHRYDLDQKPGLRSVKLVIRVNQNGLLGQINFAPEFERSLKENADEA
jgi:hypothetical protein